MEWNLKKKSTKDLNIHEGLYNLMNEWMSDQCCNEIYGLGFCEWMSFCMTCSFFSIKFGLLICFLFKVFLFKHI